MTTYITYVLLPSGWHPVRESLAESRADSVNRARALYRSHVTKTIQWATTVAPQQELIDVQHLQASRQ